MPSPRFEVPSGVIDGVNTVFYVSRAYKPGSTAVFLNGLLQERSLVDGWTETDPGAGEVTLKEAPRSSGTSPDVLQIFFIDTSPALPETEVTKIKGTIRPVSVLHGVLVDAMPLRGRLSRSPVLYGRLDPYPTIKGTVSSVQKLRAVVRESCICP